MNWLLLWREYRRNRLILATGGVLVLLACVCAYLLDLDPDDLVAPDGFFVLLVSVLTLAILAGNAIAADRADRSAEFMAYLPLRRSHLLVSKLFLPLTAVVILSAAILLTLMQQVAIQPIENRPDNLHVFGLVVSMALLICGVSWLVSSIQSSPALATLSGMFAAGISLSAASVTGRLNEIAPTFHKPGWWFSVNLIVAVGCFSVGSWYYLRNRETDVTPAHAAPQRRGVRWEVVVIAVLTALVLLGVASTLMDLLVARRDNDLQRRKTAFEAVQRAEQEALRQRKLAEDAIKREAHARKIAEDAVQRGKQCYARLFALDFGRNIDHELVPVSDVIWGGDFHLFPLTPATYFLQCRSGR